MDADERLRAGLERNAASFTPDVSAALRRVQRRRRSVIGLRPLSGIAAALVAVIALVTLTQREPEDSFTASTPTAPTNPQAPIVTRRFEATIPPAGDDDGGHLAGRWRITIDPDGTVTIDSPQDARGTALALAATISGHELIIDQSSPDLCPGAVPGRYHWSIAPWGDLDLAVVDDDCPTRIELLTGPGRTWTAMTPTPPQTTAP